MLTGGLGSALSLFDLGDEDLRVAFTTVVVVIHYYIWNLIKENGFTWQDTKDIPEKIS